MLWPMCRFGLLACCACRALAEAGVKGLPCAAAQHCCGATACRFLLRIVESPPALLPAKPVAARPQASVPKHRAGLAQQRNTREPKSSSETRLNKNPTPGGQEEDGASIPVEFQYKNSILHGRSLTLDK